MIAVWLCKVRSTGRLHKGVASFAGENQAPHVLSLCYLMWGTQPVHARCACLVAAMWTMIMFQNGTLWTCQRRRSVVGPLCIISWFV